MNKNTKRLIMRMLEKDITSVYLAKMLGRHRVTILNAITGRRPNAKLLARIEQILYPVESNQEIESVLAAADRSGFEMQS